MQLTGKVVVVTGAFGVLGRAVAREVLAQGARVALLDVASGEVPHGAAAWQVDLRSLADTRQVLDAVAEQARTRGVPVETVFVQERPAADAILATADARDVDLIVMASHGRQGLGRLPLGSQTRSVVARSERPVLVVR